MDPSAPRATASARVSRLRTALAVLGAPLLVVLATSVLLDALGLAAWLDTHRPPYGKISLRAHAEAQFARVEALNSRPRTARRVVLVGSSALVAGIDADLAAQKLASAGRRVEVVKAGHTGLRAYEIVMMSDELLSGADTVVYAYNWYAFGSRVHPQAAAIRWDTFTALRLDLQKFLLDHDAPFAAGFLGEICALCRYRSILQAELVAAATGDLRRSTWDFDHPASAVPPPVNRLRRREPPAPASDLFRGNLIEGIEDPEALGYRALRMFAARAAAAGVGFVLVPLPEPDFAADWRWRTGLDMAPIDARIRRLADELAVPLIDRDGLRAFERRDDIWLDHIHLYSAARPALSAWLAEQLAPYL